MSVVCLLSLSWTIYHIKAHLLCTSLTKLGEQSSTRNRQLLGRQVITQHKASSLQLPHKHSLQKYGCSEAVSGDNLQRTLRALVMLNLTRRLEFPIPSYGRKSPVRSGLTHVSEHFSPRPLPHCLRRPDQSSLGSAHALRTFM